ncbi:Peptide deformylase [Candidatus Hodgkinia cicadicola]|nr:Peptide deformylase [Candidatus Hodgkinia cicadicola]
MFESPCSLLTHPSPQLRLCALTRSARSMLACVNRLTITALVLNGCGINSVQIGQPIGVILTNGYQAWTRARMLPLSLVRITALGCAFANPLEGCLSLSKVFRRTLRHKLTVIIYINIANARVRAFKTQGLLATCCQHELDHNNGSLIIDA